MLNPTSLFTAGLTQMCNQDCEIFEVTSTQDVDFKPVEDTNSMGFFKCRFDPAKDEVVQNGIKYYAGKKAMFYVIPKDDYTVKINDELKFNGESYTATNVKTLYSFKTTISHFEVEVT